MEKEIIGHTALGREIVLYSGKRDSKVLLVGAVHAREHITGQLLMRICEGRKVDYVPYLNVDGVALSRDGLSSVKDACLRKTLLSWNGSEDFAMWKANAQGVDINVNFDADWGEGVKNVTYAGAENYIGLRPESEPETQAICRLIRRKKYAVVVAYHTLGEEVYWGYDWNYRYFLQAKRYAECVGYPLLRSEQSAGGLKDWYSLHFQGLGLTVEVGKSEWGHPCPQEKLDELTDRHFQSVPLLEEIGEEIARKVHERSVKAGEESL